MSDPICLTVDETAPVSRIRWRIASSGPWPAANTLEPPFGCIAIPRPPLTDIEIEVTWDASRRRRLRGGGQRRAGTGGHGDPPLLGAPRLREQWHPGACADGGPRTTRYVLPALSFASSLASAPMSSMPPSTTYDAPVV
jgi:hypothetical protein